MNTVAVVGAGVVGLCTAVFLQRSGCQVTVYDTQAPGSGASYGNGGLISPHSCMPIAMPGMLRQVPKWLLDPTGPLSVDARYFLKAAPWLLRWIQAGRTKPMTRASAALHQLHQMSLDQYQALLGELHFADHIKVTGQVHVWENEQESAGDRLAREFRDLYGIRTQNLNARDVRDLIPQISPRIKRAVLYPKSGYTANPLRLVQTLAKLLVEAGGAIVQERVMKLLPQNGASYRLLTNLSDVRAARVMVAAGAWSKQLLAPLGIGLPLEAERGYHVELVKPSIGLRIPILHKEKAIGAITMENGLRIAGLVEIGGLALPPDERRQDILLKHARDLLPGLQFEKSSLWMGFRPATPDSVPVLSEVVDHPGLFVACGHGHLGVTAGAVSGRLLSQIVLKQTPLVDPEPHRLSRF